MPGRLDRAPFWEANRHEEAQENHMATAATEDPKTVAPSVETPATPPKADTSATPKATEAPKVTPAAAKPAHDTASPAGTATRVRLGKDDDEIPEDAELLELSKTALEKRLARHSRAELKAHFGTDNASEIKKKLDRLAKFEQDEEERKRAEMSEREKMQSDLANEQRLRQDAERRALRVHTERIVEKEEVKITRLAEKHFDPDYVEDMLPRLARYLSKEFTEDQLEALSKDKAKYDRTIEKWCKEQVEKKPKLGKEAPVVKEKLDNGADDDNSRRAAGNNADMRDGKVFAPGRPNSMTSQQAKAEAAKQGYKW